MPIATAGPQTVASKGLGKPARAPMNWNAGETAAVAGALAKSARSLPDESTLQSVTEQHLVHQALHAGADDQEHWNHNNVAQTP